MQLEDNMNYELAKQLKDAGFPQEGEDFITESDGYARYSSNNTAYNPSLSELVEACGNDFKKLAKVPFTEVTGNKFFAWSWDLKDKEAVMGEGETAEEAVAKLWLELNKK